MGYLVLAATLLVGGAKGYCGKKLGGFAENTASAILLNLIRMALCVVMSLLVIVATGAIRKFTLSTELLLISALSGACTALFGVFWLLAVRKSAYMLLDVFSTLGTLIPMVLGLVLFSEHISSRQWIGFGVLLVATWILCSYQNTIKVKLTFSGLLLLLACTLASGFSSFSQKLFVKSFPQVPITVFNLLTYFFAGVILAIFMAAMAAKEKPKFESKATKARTLYLLGMSVFLIAHTYFSTLAAVYLDSARLYPLSQGGAMVISCLMATFLFGEKFTFRAFVGIALAFAALLTMNL